MKFPTTCPPDIPEGWAKRVTLDSGCVRRPARAERRREFAKHAAAPMPTAVAKVALEETWLIGAAGAGATWEASAVCAVLGATCGPDGAPARKATGCIFFTLSAHAWRGVNEGALRSALKFAQTALRDGHRPVRTTTKRRAQTRCSHLR